MTRVHRIPFSTNVERVALAAGHKGIELEWVDHRPDDRTAVIEHPEYYALRERLIGFLEGQTHMHAAA